MKLRADRAALADAITWVAQAIPRKASAPALAGVKLVAVEDSLTIQAFDYETSRTTRIDCEVLTGGECLATGRLLAEIIKSLEGREVELTLDDARVTISCGRSKYRVGAMPLSDFPTLPTLPPQLGVVHRDSLAGLVEVVGHAAGRDDMVPIMTAVHLAGDARTLEATTTDRFRIANATVGWSGADFTANIPAATLGTALKGMSGDLQLGHEDGLFGLSDGDRSLTTRTLSDGFPRLDRFLSTEPTMTIEAEAEALAGALRRADYVNDEKAPVRLVVTADEIALSADGESGEGAEFVECQATNEIEVLFSGAYLSEALLAVGAERVRLGFTTPLQPVIITPLDDRPVRMVVMPRRSVNR